MPSQLPVADQIFLDHVGHFVRDPKAAAQALVRAGFAPTPVSVQVDARGTRTGTGNVTAMFSRGYVEVLFKTAETPLAGQLDAAIARYAGVHLAAFAVADAGKAHHRLETSGFRTAPLVEMSRPVETETGPAIAAFTVARVEPGEMPEGRIQILTHHTEAAVWQPRWLVHPNGARALARVFMAVADVEEAAERFSRFTGRPASRSPERARISLDRGTIELMSADAFTKELPDVSIPSLPFIGAYEIAVSSLERLKEELARARLPVRPRDGGLVAPFPPELGHGAWLFTA